MPLRIYALKYGQAAASVGISAEKHPERCVPDLALTVALMFALGVSEFPPQGPARDECAALPGRSEGLQRPRVESPAPAHRERRRLRAAPREGKARPERAAEWESGDFTDSAAAHPVHTTAMRTERSSRCRAQNSTGFTADLLHWAWKRCQMNNPAMHRIIAF